MLVPGATALEKPKLMQLDSCCLKMAFWEIFIIIGGITLVDFSLTLVFAGVKHVTAQRR